MIFRECELPKAFILEPERLADERGFFARTFCTDELSAHGIDAHVSQCSVSYNTHAGTLRGMHLQIAPHEETKLVRCTRGAIYDVILDLRPASPTYKRWQAVELTADNGWGLLVPPGVAHGFQTLVDATEVFYQISTRYEPASARGVRWDDPSFAIRWPDATRTISARDKSFPLFGGGLT